MSELTLENIKELLTKQTDEIKRELNQNGEKFTKRIDNLSNTVQKQKRRTLALEQNHRKNNIIIFGLLLEHKNLQKETISFLNKLLGLNITISDINNVYKIGKTSEIRPIVVEFVSYLKKLEIFADIEKLKSLKNKKIAIANDLCPEDREDQKILREHLKKSREQNIPAKIKGYKIEINGTWYTVEEIKSKNDLVSSSEYESEEEPEKQNTQTENEEKEAENTKKKRKLIAGTPSPKELRKTRRK